MYIEKKWGQFPSRKPVPRPHVQYQALILTIMGALFSELAEINNLKEE